MYFEYLTDMSFVLIMIIGSIVAIFYAFMKRSKRKQSRKYR
jgi:preprotein translocase subunit YajC